MGCCGVARPKQDYMIVYQDGSTERVPALQGVLEVRRRIQASGKNGTIKMVPPLAK